MNDFPELLTAPEVAKILKIGKRKVYELMREGEIKSFSVGKRNIRTTKQALINYLKDRVGIDE